MGNATFSFAPGLFGKSTSIRHLRFVHLRQKKLHTGFTLRLSSCLPAVFWWKPSIMEDQVGRSQGSWWALPAAESSIYPGSVWSGGSGLGRIRVPKREQGGFNKPVGAQVWVGSGWRGVCRINTQENTPTDDFSKTGFPDNGETANAERCVVYGKILRSCVYTKILRSCVYGDLEIFPEPPFRCAPPVF